MLSESLARSLARARMGEISGGEGETNKSTIGNYACISDERARGMGAGVEVKGQREECLKRDEWLKSSRHNDPAICSASVHNDGDHIQQKISMPIGISFN